ncbi:MAG: hypothetical protein ACI93R_002389 [Flavobacteriales bacterium]|jgi:uncharacterized protein (DUF1330 family)
MSAHVIVEFTIQSAEGMSEYGAAAAETFIPFQGEFVSKGKNEVLHGEGAHAMKAIISFPDTDSARRWYNSDAYQALIPMRNKAMNSRFELIV